MNQFLFTHQTFLTKLLQWTQTNFVPWQLVCTIAVICKFPHSIMINSWSILANPIHVRTYSFFYPMIFNDFQSLQPSLINSHLHRHSHSPSMSNMCITLMLCICDCCDCWICCIWFIVMIVIIVVIVVKICKFNLQ